MSCNAWADAYTLGEGSAPLGRFSFLTTASNSFLLRLLCAQLDSLRQVVTLVRLEDIENTTQYFARTNMFSVLQMQRESADKAINGFNPDALLNTPTDDLVKKIVDTYQLDIPVLLRDEAHMDEPREITIPKQDYGRTIHVQGTILVLHVPFTGDPGMFWVQPTSCDSAPPSGNLNGQEMVLKMRGTNLSSEAVEKHFNSILNDFERYLNWQRPNANNFVTELKERARMEIESRKARLLADRNMVASLPFKIKARSDAPKTYVAPVTRKNVIQRPATSAPFKPEPTMDKAIYDEILDIMHSMTLVMERSPNSFAKMGEEDIRQQFLVQLNGRFEGAATGETFNYEGKTDILVRVEEKNIFIGECKFWGGPRAYLETIDQLLGYVSWRDTKTAVVIFNRNRDFSNVLKSILDSTEDHPNKKKGPEKLSETRFRYTFSNPNDVNRELLLTVMAFDIPKPQ